MTLLEKMNYSLPAACLAFLFVVPGWADSTRREDISLSQAVAMAQDADPWLQGSLLQQEAFQARSTAAGALPDPMMSVGFANLPTDTFDFNQEQMTQFKVGLSQSFPRGDSRALERQRLVLLGSRQEALREDRRAKVGVRVAELWLDSFRAREIIRLIEEDRSLFEYLVEVAQSSYASARGKTRQQDVIRAQLELTRLEDRLTVLNQQRDAANGMLGEWLGPAYPAGESVNWQQATVSGQFALASQLPLIELAQAQSLESTKPLAASLLERYLLSHPAVRSLETQVEVQRTGVAIAQQKYKPRWGVNASYGYRDNSPAGDSRADFFSMGVTFDLPLFTANRQDKEVQSARAHKEASKTEKWLLLRSMRAELATRRTKLHRLNQRRSLYGGQLLGQMREQAEASLNAYTNDDGDFAEVVRARIAELNAKIEALEINVERAKTVAQLNYFFVGGEAS